MFCLLDSDADVDVAIVSGLDLGGVIVSRDPSLAGDTNFFSDDFFRTPPTDGALNAVHHLVQQFGADNVHVVSKCNAKVSNQRVTRLTCESYSGASDS